MPSARRSGRLSGVRKSYTIDPLGDEDPDLHPQDEAIETPRNKGKKPARRIDDDESDEEFQAQGEEEDDDEDEPFGDEDGGGENDVDMVDADEHVLSAAEEAEAKQGLHDSPHGSLP